MRYVKMELTRAFHNKRILPALAFGFVLSLWHYFAYIFPIREYVYDARYPLSAYNLWLGGECYSLQSTLFYLLIPILCALPYGESWQKDCSGSVGGQAIIRGNKANYIITKMAVSFLVGAVVASLPLIFDFLLTASTIPAIVPKVGLGLSPISPKKLLCVMYYEHPAIYLALYIALNGVFFGLLNTLSLSARLISSNQNIALLAPFIVYIGLHCAGTTLGCFEICASGFLRPCQQFTTTSSILVAELLGLLAVSGYCSFRFIREEHGLL